MTRARTASLRKMLDALYSASGGLAAIFLAAIAVVVIVQIATRLLGVRVSGLDDIAAWSMGAAVFLALPATLARGGHIRILLVVDRLPARLGRIVEVIATLIGIAISIWAAWSVARYVASSFQMGQLTQGEVALPLWVPQVSMACGFILLAVAFIEHLVSVLMQTGNLHQVAAADEQLREGL